MKIDIPLNVFRHILRGLNDNPNVVELGFNFQICGRTDEGEFVVRNGSASFMFSSDHPYVLYNGTKFDTTSWFDGNILYHSDITDPNIDFINITYCNSYQPQP